MVGEEWVMSRLLGQKNCGVRGSEKALMNLNEIRPSSEKRRRGGLSHPFFQKNGAARSNPSVAIKSVSENGLYQTFNLPFLRLPK